jgi:hypothetical protein
MPRLDELARFVRSKNAKPFVLTIDILFNEHDSYDRVVKSGAINTREVATRYHVPEELVEIHLYPVAHGIKVTFPRSDPAGSFGDRDLIGAQQATPMLDLEIP